MTFDLTLIDISEDLCEAWTQRFQSAAEVAVIYGRFEDITEYDCMVSPANSFGLMDGGIDAAITHYFGHQLMLDVQTRIIDEFRGEQPVGTSIIVETHDEKHPYLAHTPTMRVPLRIAHTDNVYKAMLAMLLAVDNHNKQSERPIQHVLCPGLGTGVGRVPAAEAARQMWLAYHNFHHPPQHIDWNYASQRQALIRYGGDDGYNYPPEGHI